MRRKQFIILTLATCLAFSGVASAATYHPHSHDHGSGQHNITSSEEPTPPSPESPPPPIEQPQPEPEPVPSTQDTIVPDTTVQAAVDVSNNIEVQMK